jgi:hypothetical protein
LITHGTKPFLDVSKTNLPKENDHD